MKLINVDANVRFLLLLQFMWRVQNIVFVFDGLLDPNYTLLTHSLFLMLLRCGKVASIKCDNDYLNFSSKMFILYLNQYFETNKINFFVVLVLILLIRFCSSFYFCLSIVNVANLYYPVLTVKGLFRHPLKRFNFEMFHLVNFTCFRFPLLI